MTATPTTSYEIKNFSTVFISKVCGQLQSMNLVPATQGKTASCLHRDATGLQPSSLPPYNSTSLRATPRTKVCWGLGLPACSFAAVTMASEDCPLTATLVVKICHFAYISLYSRRKIASRSCPTIEAAIAHVQAEGTHHRGHLKLDQLDLMVAKILLGVVQVQIYMDIVYVVYED
jgi:hypothetical protein